MAQPEQPRGILQITGSDRVSFLQNLVTNEIDALGLHYAALLNPQGTVSYTHLTLPTNREV